MKVEAEAIQKLALPDPCFKNTLTFSVVIIKNEKKSICHFRARRQMRRREVYKQPLTKASKNAGRKKKRNKEGQGFERFRKKL